MFTFRLVVRGNNSEGVRVRRVRSIEASSYEAAWADFGEDHAKDMADGLRDMSYSVLPPLGWRMDGTPSPGYTVA